MEGDFLNFRLAVTLKISIHALRMEGDFIVYYHGS